MWRSCLDGRPTFLPTISTIRFLLRCLSLPIRKGILSCLPLLRNMNTDVFVPWLRYWALMCGTGPHRVARREGQATSLIVGLRHCIFPISHCRTPTTSPFVPSTRVSSACLHSTTSTIPKWVTPDSIPNLQDSSILVSFIRTIGTGGFSDMWR